VDVDRRRQRVSVVEEAVLRRLGSNRLEGSCSKRLETPDRRSTTMGTDPQGSVPVVTSGEQ
jgi:hypothetical protein